MKKILLIASILSFASVGNSTESGFYIAGGGVCTKTNSRPVMLDHELEITHGFDNLTAYDIDNANYENYSFMDGTYGNYLKVNSEKVDDSNKLYGTINEKFVNINQTYPGGSFSFGYRKIFKNSVYVGVDLSIDITRTKKTIMQDNLSLDNTNATGTVSASAFSDIKRKVCGISPVLALKFGKNLNV